jgi:GPH family glycoside/pentoside/hexuronide:cation symporter
LFSSPQFGFPVVVGCLAFLGAIFAFLCFFNTKEIYSKPYEKRVGLKKITKMVFTNFPLHFVILALLTTWIANNIKQLTVIYFVKYNLQLEAYFSPILLGVILQIMLGAYLINLIKHKFEKKTLFMIGTFLYVITDLIIYFITGYENFWLLAFIASPGFVGFGMAGVMAWSMIADTVEYGEWKSGFRAEGILNSTHVFVFKLSVGFSAWLAGVILDNTNYIANSAIQSEETLNGLFIMGYIFPSIAGTIAIVVMYFNKYDSIFYKKIFSELKQR